MIPHLVNFCIPVTARCNQHCSYCYRASNPSPVPERASRRLLDWLERVPPGMTMHWGGGEPLLNFEAIQETNLHVPAGIHKHITSNGTMLTHAIVDWCNAHDIGIYVSYDGPDTIKTRGYDVLADKKLVSIIRGIDHLTVNCVITPLNLNIRANYTHIRERLGRDDFRFQCQPCTDNGRIDLSGFDYTEYALRLAEFRSMRVERPAWYMQEYLDMVRIRQEKNWHEISANPLLDGRLVSRQGMFPLGDVDTPAGQVIARYNAMYAPYIKAHCSVCPISTEDGGPCPFSLEGINEHLCRCHRIRAAVRPEEIKYVPWS